MSVQNKGLVRKFYEEVMSKGNLAAIDQLCVPDFADRNAMPGQAPGAEGLKQMFGMFRTAFPDMKVTVEEMIAEKDLVSARITLVGTHKGSFMGETPTGKKVTMKGLDLLRIKKGKMTEVWHYGDDMAVMGELGIKPPA